MKEMLEEFILTLSETYGKPVTIQRIDLYAQILETELEPKDLAQLYLKITKSCKFFPSPAEILEVAGKAKPSSRKLAENLVDEAIAAFTYKPKKAYEVLGSENYNLMKRIGMDPYGLGHGLQNPKFERGAWVDRLEREFENKVPNAVALPSAQESKQLLKVIDKKLLGGE